MILSHSNILSHQAHALNRFQETVFLQQHQQQRDLLLVYEIQVTVEVNMREEKEELHSEDKESSEELKDKSKFVLILYFQISM